LDTLRRARGAILLGLRRVVVARPCALSRSRRVAMAVACRGDALVMLGLGKHVCGAEHDEVAVHATSAVTARSC
jgi:hypothetical protein